METNPITIADKLEERSNFEEINDHIKNIEEMISELAKIVAYKDCD